MKELIFHILHKRSPFGKDSYGVTHKMRVDHAPRVEYACALDTSSEEIFHFTSDNADELTKLICTTPTIISYRGKEFGLFVLRKHHGLVGRFPKGWKHIDIHDLFLTINNGKNVSLERAVFSNIGKNAYIQRKAFNDVTSSELKTCCESDILHIYQLYKSSKENSLILRKMPKKLTKKSDKKQPKKKIDYSYLYTAKLTIELVPQSCWLSNVRSAVTQKYWDIIRKKTYKNNGYKCEICNGIGSRHPVECHEIWEYDDYNYVQKLVGFIALCPSCHEVKHIGNANRLGRGDIAKKHLAKVNGWSSEEVDYYLLQVFKTWAICSTFNYKLDLSLLDKMGIEYKSDRILEI